MATNEHGSQNYTVQNEDNDTVGEGERVWRVSKTKAQLPHETAGWFSFQDFLSNNSLPAFQIHSLLFFLSALRPALARKTFLIHLAH